jgi:hypothetical protein
MGLDKWAGNYREEEAPSFEVLKPGKYRVRIKSAEQKVSQVKPDGTGGNDMIEVHFTVSKTGHTLRYYLVFNDRDAASIARSNANVTALFRSFGIKPGDFNLNGWVGKVGAVSVKIEQYNGEDRNSVAWCVEPKDQGGLEPWVEPTFGTTSTSRPEGSTGSSGGNPYKDADGNNDCPF